MILMLWIEIDRLTEENKTSIKSVEGQIHDKLTKSFLLTIHYCIPGKPCVNN